MRDHFDARTRPSAPGVSLSARAWQEAGMKLTTWNINSVRIRTEQVARFVAEHSPTGRAVPAGDQMPGRRISRARPLSRWACRISRSRARRAWHGVAIASRLPIEPVAPLDVCREGPRPLCVSAKIAGIEVQNFYIPAGGDVPDRALNPKFDHKLDFYERLTALARQARPQGAHGDGRRPERRPQPQRCLEGHRQMLKVVNHTRRKPRPCGGVERLAGSFTDLVREAHPEPEKLFSWWSYRAADLSALRTAACAWTISG